MPYFSSNAFLACRKHITIRNSLLTRVSNVHTTATNDTLELLTPEVVLRELSNRMIGISGTHFMFSQTHNRRLKFSFLTLIKVIFKKEKYRFDYKLFFPKGVIKLALILLLLLFCNVFNYWE